MKVYVLDANALVRLYRNLPGADTVQKLIEQAKTGRSLLFISVINLAEVLYVLAKYFSKDENRQFLAVTRTVVVPVLVDEESAFEAAALRIQYKIGLADCFAAGLAIRRDATLVTAGADFAKLGKRVKILALPSHRDRE